MSDQIINEWIENMSAKIERPICRQLRDGDPAPYLIFSNDSYDGFIYFTIDGFKIKAGHVWAEPGSDFDPIRLPTPEEDGETAFVGYKSDTGIWMMVDPTTLVYYDGITEGRPDVLKLFLDHTCTQFFESWHPGQMSMRLVSIFTRMRSRNLQKLADQKERDMSRVRTAQDTVNLHMESLANTQRRMLQTQSMDPSGFLEECRGWEEVLLRQGSLRVDNDGNIVFRMPVFTINDQTSANNGNGNDIEIGPLSIYFNLDNYNLKVTSEDHLSYGDSIPHPHVSRDGAVCFGRSARHFESMMANPNPMEVLFATAQFLQTGYHPPGAYQRLENWLPPRGWMCDHCRIRHDDGVACPQHCSHCDTYVNWDNHAHCSEHIACYERPAMCEGCLDLLPKIGDFATDIQASSIPPVIRPVCYTNPENDRTLDCTLEYVGIGRRAFLKDGDGNFYTFIKDGDWHWIQSSDPEDSLLRECDYIYRKQANGTYQLHWTNPNPEVIDPESEEADDEEPEELDTAAQLSNLFDHYYEDGMGSAQLVEKLHTDSIPSYDDVPEQLQDALRAFRRRSNNQRRRQAARFIEGKNRAA